MSIEVKNDGIANPLIVVDPDEVLAWLREKADAAGFADRQLCLVQVTVTQPFVGGNTYHHETPTLIAMVSNTPNSR